MRYTLWITLGVFLISGLAIAAQAATYSIPADKLDAQKVYFGKAEGFERPAGVDYETIIKATPEYEEVKKKKIEPGTGRYWILLSQASDRVVRSISEVAQEMDYDFIASQGYLGSLDPAIPSEDITQLVLDKLASKKSAKN